VTGDRLLRGGGDGGGIALAHFLPFGDRPAGRAIAVDGIVRAGLVGDRVGTDAARQHLRHDFRRVAEQADAGRFGCGVDDLERFADAGRAAVEIARLEPFLDAAVLDFDGDAVSAGHHRRERLRAAHPAEPGGQDPPARKIAAIMLAAHFGEGLVRALHDALRADVDPAARGHLAVHHQPGAIELVEHLPIGPFGHQVGIGDQHPRRVFVGAEHADRLARLDQQSFLVAEPFERFDDAVETCPVARGTADATVNDEALRVLGDRIVEIVHQHPHRGFGRPAPGHDLASAPRADVAAVVASVGSHAFSVIASAAKQSSVAQLWIAASLRSSQ
jgi:hypothetical protein